MSIQTILPSYTKSCKLHKEERKRNESETFIDVLNLFLAKEHALTPTATAHRSSFNSDYFLLAPSSSRASATTGHLHLHGRAQRARISSSETSRASVHKNNVSSGGERQRAALYVQATPCTSNAMCLATMVSIMSLLRAYGMSQDDMRKALKRRIQSTYM